MNKAQLIETIAAAQGITKAAAAKNVETFLSVVSGELSKGGSVQLIGFGSFNVAQTAARKGRNPRTGETIKIAAYKRVRFNIGSKLREAVNTKAKKVAAKAPAKVAAKPVVKTAAKPVAAKKK